MPRLAIILAAALLVVPHGKARAGGSLEVYWGSGLSPTADVSVSERSGSGTTSAAASIDLTSTELGARLVGWHPSHAWLGLAMDVGYLHANGTGVDIDAVPLSFLLALRAPLFPAHGRSGGRLQPYVMGGISFHLVDISVELDGMGGDSFKGGWPLPGTQELLVGPCLAAGVGWQPMERVAFFGEYRYSTFDVGFDTTNSMILPTMNGRVDTSVTTDHALLGLAYKFMEGR